MYNYPIFTTGPKTPKGNCIINVYTACQWVPQPQEKIVYDFLLSQLAVTSLKSCANLQHFVETLSLLLKTILISDLALAQWETSQWKCDFSKTILKQQRGKRVFKRMTRDSEHRLHNQRNLDSKWSLTGIGCWLQQRTKLFGTAVFSFIKWKGKISTYFK